MTLPFKKRLNMRGSALFAVLALMIMAVLLGTTALILASSSYNQTQQEFRSQQAYYTASGALEGMLEYLGTDESLTLRQKITTSTTAVTATSPAGDALASTIGTYTITILPIGTDLFKITAQATYAGSSRSASAYVTINSSASIDAVFLVKGTIGSSSMTMGGHNTIIGDSIFDLATLQINTVTLAGDLYNVGNLILGDCVYNTAKAKTPIDLVSGGNMTISGEAYLDINGGVFSGGNLSFSGGCNIAHLTDDIYVGGSFYGAYENIGSASNPIDLYIGGNYSNGNWQTIYGDVYVAGSFYGPNITVHGTIYSVNAISSSNIKSGTKVVRVDSINLTPLDEKLKKLSAVDSYGDWIIPDSQFAGSTYEIDLRANYSSYTISRSGTITKYQADGWYNRTLNIDTTAGDIYLKVNTGQTTFDFGEFATIRILGTHNVYFYLPGNLNYTQDYATIGSNEANPQFFLITNGTGTIKFGNQTALRFNGYIYAPNAMLDIQSASSSETRIRGGVVAGYVNYGSSALTFEYISPPADIAYSPISGTDLALAGFGQ